MNRLPPLDVLASRLAPLTLTKQKRDVGVSLGVLEG